MASSRPLRAGSIAARAQQVGAVARASHPAHYGRAPLRPDLENLLPGLPVGHPAHYGAGSIAADGLRGAGRPARRVIPPITGGLHCGNVPAATSAGRRPVIPPITGGLHCGRVDRSPPRRRTWIVIPPTTGGLHCGDQDFTNEPGAELRSSRPLRAGSIAARTRRCRPCRRPSHPAAAAEAVDVRQRWPGRRLVLADAPLARLTRIISRQAAAVAASNAPRTAT